MEWPFKGLFKNCCSNGEQTILVLAASNHPWLVDEAFRRRFEKRIYIPLPNGAAREEMLKLHLVGMKVDSHLNLQKIAKKLDGYSGADILSVCRYLIKSYTIN